MNQAPSKKESVRLTSTSDGLHLEGSILWLDSRHNGQLSFLSSALTPVKTNVPQVIATEETSKILEVFRQRPTTLICQYNRPFSIGKLRMELLPSGSVLGGASLFVETGKLKLLYAPCIQAQPIPTVRQMQLKKAHALILGAHIPEPKTSFPSRRKEKERLVQSVSDSIAQGQYPIILCQAIGTSQEVCKLLSDAGLPVAVHSSIHKINRVYDTYGSQLGAHSVYYPRRTKKRVILFPFPQSTHGRIPTLPEGPLFVIRNHPPSDESFDAFDDATDTFVIGTTSEASELKESVLAVKPRELYFTGAYAKSYVEEFKSLAPSVKALFPNDQPTLF